MANTCTECDGSGYYGSWGREKHCLWCRKGRANLLSAYNRHHQRLTLAEEIALETARTEAQISVDTVPARD